MNKRIKEFIVSRDGFGETISLTYKGEDTHKTCLGGFCSVFLRTFFLVYFILAIFTLATDPEYNI